jgi:hypothetical protein
MTDMTPSWYRNLLDTRTRPESALELASAFLAAPEQERRAIRAAWDPEARWALPNPWRLSCPSEPVGSPLERVAASLVFLALAMPAQDGRDAIVSMAILYNSAELAGIDAAALFERVAAAFPGAEGDAIRAFAARRPQDRSMAAFLLTAVEQEDGGFEIRPGR